MPGLTLQGQKYTKIFTYFLITNNNEECPAFIISVLVKNLYSAFLDAKSTMPNRRPKSGAAFNLVQFLANISWVNGQLVLLRVER
jgi:hypothetical protein